MSTNQGFGVRPPYLFETYREAIRSVFASHVNFKALTKDWYLPNSTNVNPPLPNATSIAGNFISAFTGGMPAGVSHTGSQALASGSAK